ncbi:MAG: hypothetical protein HY343_02900 [Lentisphaerae bacterium]|nr:hypothetical protein [Lentisphaerota bacterium]
MPEYSDIEMAIEYVSSAPEGTNRVVYDKVSRRFFYASDFSGENEIPDDLDWKQCVEMPHKHELDLGHDLVFRFVEQVIPSEEHTVHKFFTRPGAYARFKDFLDRRELLQAWYDFEALAQREAIERWCKDNGLEITANKGAESDPLPGST